MKRIIILRHAKSSWHDTSLADFNRPLAPRGEKDVPRVANVLNKMRLIPDLIMASPAQRAKETAQILAAEIKYPQEEITWVEDFYHADVQTYVNTLRGLPKQVEVVLLVAHNPTLAELGEWLMGRQAHPEEAIRLPTAGMMLFDTTLAKWKDLYDGAGALQWFVIPRLLKML